MENKTFLFNPNFNAQQSENSIGFSRKTYVSETDVPVNFHLVELKQRTQFFFLHFSFFVHY